MLNHTVCRFFCAGLLAFSLLANAQTYPDRPVTIIAPFAAGGDADIAARNLAAVAQRLLGQNVIVANRAGASGAIGSLAVRNAKPDGYNLLLARVGSQAVLPAMQKNLEYQWNSFSFIGLLELNPVVCAVRSESPFKNMSDLVEALRSRPGKLNYSTSGAGTILNFGPQLLFDVLGLGKDAAVQIAYKGGKLRALLTTTPDRLKDLPEVPTARETGFPQLEAIVGWSALYGPPGMDKSATERWVSVLQAAARDPQWIAATEKVGSTPRVLSPAETEKFVAEQYAVYDKLGRLLGLTLKQ